MTFGFENSWEIIQFRFKHVPIKREPPVLNIETDETFCRVLKAQLTQCLSWVLSTFTLVY